MIHSIQFTCVLDTNVIYPIDVRDLLFWFAFHELYTPKWSEHIFDEWKSVMIKKEVPEDEADKRILKAQLAFPDALVKNYESLIEGLELPDLKDRHVLAAAIKVNADLIITNNLKDFPKDYLAQYGLTAKSADDFITDIIDLNPKEALQEVIESYRKSGEELPAELNGNIEFEYKYNSMQETLHLTKSRIRKLLDKHFH